MNSTSMIRFEPDFDLAGCQFKGERRRKIRQTIRGFTLVELLTVMAILAVLAAMILSAISTVKRSAYDAQTLSNLRQLSVGVALYQADFDDFFPGATDGDLGVSMAGGWVWYDVYHPNRSGHFDVSKGTLFAYTNNAQIYLCPLDEHRTTSGLSYALNSCLVGALSGTGLTQGEPSSIVQAPAQIMLFGEEGTGADGQDDTNDGYFASKYDHFSNWHAGGTALAFADGHAKIRRVESEPSILQVTTGGVAGFCN